MFHTWSGTYDTVYYDYSGYSIDLNDIMASLNQTQILNVSYDSRWHEITVTCKCLYNAKNGGETKLKYLIYGSDGSIYKSGTIYDWPVTGEIWTDDLYVYNLPDGEYTIRFGNNNIGSGYDLY